MAGNYICDFVGFGGGGNANAQFENPAVQT